MEEFTHFYQPQPMNGGIAEMDTTAAEAVPGAVPFAWGHMTLSTDAQGKVRVAAAAPPVAAGDEHRPEVGDLVLAVDDTHAGIANDPRAVLESILRDAAASGQRTLRLTLARPSPDSGSGWLTFSCEIPVEPRGCDASCACVCVCVRACVCVCVCVRVRACMRAWRRCEQKAGGWTGPKG